MPDLRETPYQPRVVLGSAGKARLHDAADLLDDRGAPHMAKVLRAVAGALRPGQRISLILGPEVEGADPAQEPLRL